MEEKFELCYIDENKAWFTADWENQWGDDWNDRPYECNAGEPYEHNYHAPEQGVKDGRGIYPEIKHKTLYFDFPWRIDARRPCDMGRFSVEDINRGVVAWLSGDNFVIPAKTSYEDFIKIVKDNEGKIYEEV